MSTHISIREFTCHSIKSHLHAGNALATVSPNISEIFTELKLDREQTISKANSEEIENEYLSNTDSARKNKVFGSPSFVVNSEIFWGDDRMEDAITWSKK